MWERAKKVKRSSASDRCVHFDRGARERALSFDWRDAPAAGEADAAVPMWSGPRTKGKRIKKIPRASTWLAHGEKEVKVAPVYIVSSRVR